MMDLRTIARALGGEVAGRQVLAPGPSHSRADRSLSVRLSPTARDGFTVHSHADDDWRLCRDHVASRLGLPAFDGRRRDPSPAEAARRDAARREAERDDEADRERRRVRAAALWQEAHDPTGTLVERYLSDRKIELPADVAGEVIRFHPTCPYRDTSGALARAPAMIAAMRGLRSDAFAAIHRTFLSPNGEKIGRKMLGLAAGTAIKLDADESVMTGLTIGEGVETVLTARQLGFQPAWAMGSVDAIAGFPVLSGIECLTILEEVDETGASARAVERCGTRWHDAGREVIVVRPKAGSDLNDAIREIAA